MDFFHKRYFRTHQNAPYYFHLNFSELNDDIKFIEQNRIENIRLSEYPDFCITSLDPVFKIRTPIKRLVVFIKNIDLGPLSQLNTLEELTIGETPTNIDLTNFKNLKELYLVYTKNIKGFSSLGALEQLTIIKPKASFFSVERFDNLIHLKSLTVLSGQVPEQLDFLRKLANLKELEIHNVRSVFSIKEVASLKKLKILKIGCCMNVQNLEKTLPALQELNLFALTDSCVLESTSFVDSMPKLQDLIVLGRSYFENGDLSILRNKLQHVGIDNKRHYSLKYEDFKK